MAEFDLIDLLAARCAASRADVVLGIGDDGAILAPPPGEHLVVVTDTLVAGVHFPLSTAPFDLGWKALAVNLSDLAAMGATPLWASLALTLPEPSRVFVQGFADGFATLASRHGVALIGGDTTRGPLAVTVTLHGAVPPGQALRRDGARAGDAVYVTGSLGDAAAALQGLLDPAAGEVDARLRTRLDRPEPRVEAGLALRGAASACIDISDGLVADLGHVARRSGVAIEIEVDALPASPALFEALPDRVPRRAAQAAGGDDYELAFTLDPAHELAVRARDGGLGVTWTRIGRVVEGEGVRVIDRHGHDVVLPRAGWEHFA